MTDQKVVQQFDTAAEVRAYQYAPNHWCELTITWPKTGRKITYLAGDDKSFSLIASAIEAAGDSPMSLRIHDMAVRTEQSQRLANQESDNDIVDGLLWKQGRVSVRAISQFRKYAPQEIQKLVNYQTVGGNIKVAKDTLKPYGAYRIFSDIDHLPEHARNGIISIDFDGVIADTETHEPMPNAVESVRKLINDGWDVFVMSTKAIEPEGLEYIHDWLLRYELPEASVTGIKVPAEIYIDDRAIHFSDWESAMEDIGDRSSPGSFLCEEDKSQMEITPSHKEIACPACDKRVSILERAIPVYAFVPGDKVRISNAENKTIGDAYLISHASKNDERVLRGSNLWFVRFSDDQILPVAQGYLTKLGADENSQKIIDAGYQKELAIESKPKSYNYDKVLEESLASLEEADVAIAKAASKYSLDAEDVDLLSEQILEASQEERPMAKESILDQVSDAIEESDAFFQEAGLIPSAEEETEMVLAYLGETMNWSDEMVDKDTPVRLAELINHAREGTAIQSENAFVSPRWIESEKDKDLWKQVAREAGVGPGYAAVINLFRQKKNPKMIQDEQTGEDEGSYMPTDMPSTTSTPEGEYDRVRFQTQN